MPPSSFYNLPDAWNPGYEIPEYVMAEPPGRGVMVTDWLPRGTISELVPEFQPVRLEQPGGLGSLGDDTLGVQQRAAGQNPIANYGPQAAGFLMRAIKTVPTNDRPMALRAIFDAIDPSLWRSVERQANQYRAKGYAAPQALERAMAEAMSAGFVRELVQTGKRAMNGQRQPVRRQGQLALGVYPDAIPTAQAYALEALGFSLSDLNPVKYIKAGASAVASGVKSAASATASFVKNGVKYIGGLACKAVNSTAGQIGAAAVGGPAGAAGAQAAQGMCSSGGGAAAQPVYAPPPPSSLPSWVKPAAIGGGILLGAVLLTRSRK